jgi:hypothetical protein
MLEEVRSQHRRDETRGEQREEHLHRDGDAELLEELSGDARHEACGCEDRDDGQRDRDHREADLVGGLERGAIGRFAHVHVPNDVLDLDDGVVDQDTRRQRDGEEADEVEREAEQVHRPERREDRQRQRDRGNDGGAQVAQEQQHDDDGEDGALEQGRNRRVVIAVGVLDRGVDHLEVDVGIGGLERVDALLNGLGHLHVAGALGTLDAERDDRLAVEAGEGAAIGDGVGDGAEIVEPDLAAAEQRNHGAGKVTQRLGARERADRLVVLADLGAAAGNVDIGAAQALADIDGGQAHGLQAVRVERDQDLALDAADAFDLGNAADALQRALDHVVDEIGELLGRLAGRDRGIGDDRQADDVDALDQRLGDVLRQVGAHPRHRVLDVVEGAVGVGLQRELDRGDRHAVGDRGGDVPHALDAGDGVFDRLGDLGFELGGCRAELRDHDRDHGNVGRRQPRHCELGEGDPAEDQQDDREDDRRQRIADRPCRNIESHQRTRVRSSSSANMVLIWSPSWSEEPASATTISPTWSPSRISVALSDDSPTRTLRVSMVLPPLTT